MGWSSKTQATPANIRKRIIAALEAIEGAKMLTAQHPKLGKRCDKALANAKLWLIDAEDRTRGN